MTTTIEVKKEQLQAEVEAVLNELPSNRFGLSAPKDGFRQIDSRWWVFLHITREPEHRIELWDQLADIEQRLEDRGVPALVAAEY